MSLKRKRVFKHKLPTGELNVVSLMDILTTLLFFLLLAASFTRLASLNASGFISNKSFASDDQKKPVFTLEVIVRDPKNATIWLGPLTGLRVAREDDLHQYLGLQFKGDAATGFSRKIEANDPKALVSLIQQTLIPIKRSFPNELTAVVAFTDRVPYQQMVDSVAGVKSLGDTHEGVTVSSVTGGTESTKVLFPEIVISEWGEGA